MSQRPHIICILSDQHGGRHLGVAGDPVMRSPRLDQLAQSGAFCRQTYASSPLCVPSRMSLLSGLSAMHTGVHANSQSLASHVPTIAHSLGAAGYRSVLCGRMHFLGPDQRHGYRERLVGDHGATDTAQSESDMGIFAGCTGQDAWNLLRSGSGWSTVQAYDSAVRDAAVQRIRQHTQDSPLFLTVGFYGPHNPFVCSREQFSYYQEHLSPIRAEDVARYTDLDHPAIAYWRHKRQLDTLDIDTLNRARAAYYGACETIDGHVGSIVEAADKHFGQEQVLIVYISDHGEMAGERGMFWKSNFFESSVRVPWILRWTGHIPPSRQETPLSLLDLAPTLAGLVDAPQLPGVDGRDVSSDLLAGRTAEQLDVVSTLLDRRGSPSAMIRRGPWKMIVHHGYEEPEFYNLESDPDEMRNQAADPQHAGMIRDLRRALDAVWDPQAVEEIASVSAQQAKLIQAAHAQHPEERREAWQADLSQIYLDQEGA